jgi:hypothetical protein
MWYIVEQKDNLNFTLPSTDQAYKPGHEKDSLSLIAYSTAITS